MAILKYKDTVTHTWKTLPFTAQISTGLPVGIISPYAGNTPPNGWLICDGSAINRADYPELFNIIGTTYGSGDGASTFNLPDIKGKVIVGVDNSDTDFGTIGKVLGEKTHTLTTEEMPGHSHDGGTSDGKTAFMRAVVVAGDFYARNHVVSNGSGVYKDYGEGSSDFPGANHYHTFTTNSTGGSQAHNNIQPSFVTNYIIKAKETTNGIIATVENTLDGTSTIDALSAYQGKVLNDKINNLNIYSTNETNTGKIWINGKNIYRKVFYIESPTFSSDRFSFNHNITNFEMFTDLKGNVYDPVNSNQLPLPYSTTTTANIMLYTSSTQILLEQKAYGASRLKNLYVTIEYTKTN